MSGYTFRELEDDGECVGYVFKNYRDYPCHQPGTVKHVGRWYCEDHYPPAVAARRADETNKWKAQWDKEAEKRVMGNVFEDELWRKAAAYDRLMEEVNRAADLSFLRMIEVRAMLESDAK